MKKLYIALALLCAALSAGAQNMYDAMTFSQNIYSGSARTIALGGAVTAVGGDLGTIGVNPAGSAVAGYSQLTISPGLSLSASTSSWSSVGETQWGAGNDVTHSRAYLPNLGISFNMETGRSWGLKSLTFAFVSNHTCNYDNRFTGFGTNSATSRFGEFAVASTGIPCSTLGDYDSFYNSDVSWDLLTGYNAGLFSDFGDGNTYVGSSEMISEDGKFCYVPGPLAQMSEVVKTGYKSDILLNMGLNFDDTFYLGLNLGMPSGEYQVGEYYTESAVSPDLFPITFKEGGKEYPTEFVGGTFDYRYTADISGVYAKLGAIWLPGDNLRIGAAVQTPTVYTIKEQWQYSASSSFGESLFDSWCDSPLGEYTYCLYSPWMLNVGLAWTFGAYGLLSVDYEMTDYSVMKFTDLYENYYDTDIYREQNEVNSLFAGRSHNLRVGGELRLFPDLSLRAGVSLLTSPERHYTDSRGSDVTADVYLSNYEEYHSRITEIGSAQYYRDLTTSFSAGLGYSSPGSFFADLALRATKYPQSYFSPYYDYENFNAAGILVNASSPRIRTDRSLWELVATVGWRF